MRRVEMNATGSEIVFTKHPVKAPPCTMDSYFSQRSRQKDIMVENITKFNCLDNSELFFSGSIESPYHSYLHFEMLACNEDELR